MTPEAMAANIILAKVFTIPSLWSERRDAPGYLEHRPDMEMVSKTVLRGLRDYGGNAGASQLDGPMPIADVEYYRQRTGITFRTYREYYSWVEAQPRAKQ
jgi:hypothetical protein